MAANESGIIPGGVYPGTSQRVAFGPGSIRQLEAALADLGVSRALVVTGPTVSRTRLVNVLRDAAGSVELTVYAGSEPHSPREACRKGLAALRETRAEALITLGGSSPVDVARGIALLYGTGKDFSDLEDHPQPGNTETLPILAVTTTLCQAEFTNIGGVTHEETGEKQLFIDNGLIPRHVFLDSELTWETPLRLWWSTGIKGLHTAIDLFMQYRGEQPFWDPVLVRAIGQLMDLLVAHKDAPDDLHLRQRLQIAAWMGAFPRCHLPVDSSIPAGPRWFGAAARHQLGGMVRAPHGELGGILLKEGLIFHLEETRQRQQALAEALGKESPQMLHQDLEDLVAFLGLPTRLSEVGVTRSHLERVVANIIREEPAFAPREQEIIATLERIY